VATKPGVVPLWYWNFQACSTEPLQTDDRDQCDDWENSTSCVGGDIGVGSGCGCVYHPADHFNYGPATYQGTVYWKDFSNSSLTQDWDYNLTLSTKDFVGADAEDYPKDAIHCEFESHEVDPVISSTGAPAWWLQFYQLAHYGCEDVLWTGTACNTPPSGIGDMIPGNSAVLTGVLGLDGCHGGGTEIHPVYAMAIEENYKTLDNDRWAVLMRNGGNEGACSSHYWVLSNNGLAEATGNPLTLVPAPEGTGYTPLGPPIVLKIQIPWQGSGTTVPTCSASGVATSGGVSDFTCQPVFVSPGSPLNGVYVSASLQLQTTKVASWGAVLLGPVVAAEVSINWTGGPVRPVSPLARGVLQAPQARLLRGKRRPLAQESIGNEEAMYAKMIKTTLTPAELREVMALAEAANPWARQRVRTQPLMAKVLPVTARPPAPQPIAAQIYSVKSILPPSYAKARAAYRSRLKVLLQQHGIHSLGVSPQEMEKRVLLPQRVWRPSGEVVQPPRAALVRPPSAPEQQ